jgi:hypothetical protein
MANHIAVFEKAIVEAPLTPPAASSESAPGLSNGKQPSTVRRRPSATIRFIRGPIPLGWLAEASALSRSAARLSVALWYRLGLTGQHVDLVAPGDKPLVVRIDRKLREECKLDRWHVSDGIRDLLNAGLIRIVKAGRGRCPEVAILASADQGPLACRVRPPAED